MTSDPSDLQSASLSETSSITVVIPTYNRAAALMTCLDHLERQQETDFEVIVVDDGSIDDTGLRMAQYLQRTPLRLRYTRQENAGPARARNQAITMSRSPICVMIGDDIFVAPAFIAAHLRFHREHPRQNVAALGLTRWNQTAQTVTPFMRWLDEGGIQFAYGDLMAGMRPDWRHFYTSNLSLKTQFLRDNPFCEDFPTAIMEDIELGYRLERRHGMKLSFIPEALAEHLHPTTFRQTCQRFFGAGVSSQLFDRLWPERQPPPSSALRRRLSAIMRRNPWILASLTRLTDLITRVWCPNPLLRPVLELHASTGYNRRDPAPSVKPVSLL